MSSIKGSNSRDPWIWYINKHLGKGVGRKYLSVKADITAVDCGIKPGYLYDVGEPDPCKLANLLKDLKSAELISNFCNVLQVGFDCIIVNADTVDAMEVSANNLKGQLVDVSHNKASPCRYDGCIASEQLYKTFTEIKHNLDSKRVHIYNLLNPGCNVSSLFGLLLGYPVLYWYNDSEDHHGNCLSMETLCCVKLTAKFTGSKLFNVRSACQDKAMKHCLYAYSYPACLSDHFESSVNQWFMSIQDKLGHSQAFTDPELVQEDEVFESLNL